MPLTNPHPTVTVPWARRTDVPRELIDRAYGTCKRADKGHCINSNLIRAFAEHLNRKIRSPGTYKGAFHWSEEINGQWCKFAAPLTEKYAKKIDAYDHDAKHFFAPIKPPFGSVYFVGYSDSRRDTRVQRDERRERLNARVEDGILVPGARFRERQLPYVRAA